LLGSKPQLFPIHFFQISNFKSQSPSHLAMGPTEELWTACKSN